MSTELARPGFFNRIGSFLRRSLNEVEVTRREIPSLVDQIHSQPRPMPPVEPESNDDDDEPRTTFIRPWNKREQAFDQLQNGVAALSDLMNSIRDSLDKNADRQGQLYDRLSQLPEVIQSLPETGRLQGEALQAIQAGIQQQNTQQNRLAEVLDRMGREGSTQGDALRAIQQGLVQQNLQQAKLNEILERLHRDKAVDSRTLDNVRQRVDSISQTEEAISENLTSVGRTLESVCSVSQVSTSVLETLRDKIVSRDSELERVIRRQNTRFTTMLSVAIVLSMAALTTVAVFGYLGYEALSHMAR